MRRKMLPYPSEVTSLKLSERLSTLRKEKKLSQEAVAEALGVSRQAVSKWETSQTYPDTENLLKLAALYQKSVDELVGLENGAPEATGPDTTPKKPRRAFFRALVAAAAVILAVIMMLLFPNDDDTPSGNTQQTPAAAVDTSFTSFPSPPAPSASSQETVDITLDVYLAFKTLSGGNASDAETSKCRLTVYQGLQAMDWSAYCGYGEAGKDLDTRFDLLDWLAAQNTLSAEELDGLIAGMNNRGIDGAYTEPYAQALCTALIAYPREFIKSIATLPDTAYAGRVCHMAIYGAAYNRLDEAKAAIDSAVHFGGLTDTQSQWSDYLLDCCDDPYNEKAASFAS
jgi:transcriptional regulator with XRE-family HTH domain